MNIDKNTTDIFALNYFDSLMRANEGKGHLVTGKIYQGGNF